jgi:hypothetical protein
LSLSGVLAETVDLAHAYLPAALNVIPNAWFQGTVDEAGRIAAFDPDRIAPLRAVGQSISRRSTMRRSRAFKLTNAARTASSSSCRSVFFTTACSGLASRA